MTIVRARRSKKHDADKWIAQVRVWALSHPQTDPVVDDSRESAYGGDLSVFTEPEHLVLARRALSRLDERANEDIDAWAEQIADDVCDATD